ncbi:MAG: hypothetical protein WCB68_21990 [Pyrinomonadaceae bacterium]
MHTCGSKTSNCILLIATFALVALASACQNQPATNANANAANANTSPANANVAIAVPPASVINTKEPEKYRATLVLSAETEGGEKTVGIPTLTAEVARRGTDRRVSFKLPDGSPLIYLDHDNKSYVILPARKQYAELTQAATGIPIQKLMTPGQIVSYLENVKGYEKVGEEDYNGRKADKYRYAKTSNTNTSAGSVNTEAFVYVDKETGLPLHAVISSEASNNVQGVKGVRIAVDLKDIKTDVADADFQIPEGLNKVSEEQIRQQRDALINTASALIQAIVNNMKTQGGGTTSTPTTNANTNASSSTSTAASPTPAHP